MPYMVQWSLPGRDQPITRYAESVGRDRAQEQLVFTAINSGRKYWVSTECPNYVVEVDELPPDVRDGAVEVNHGP